MIPELRRAVVDAGFTDPRPIQRDAIPPALEGRDVLGLAQTGTGKTAAFVLPILQRLLGGRGSGPRALVVAPTRELAAQVHAEFERLARHTKLTSTPVFGGVPIARQARALQRRPDVVVACPGRLLDLLERGDLSLRGVEVLVLDEADHMFDMGFLPDVRRILRALPERRQNLLFSATMPKEIRRLADNVLHRPAVVELSNSQPAETIDQFLYFLGEGQKLTVLERLLADESFHSAIVFLRTKRRTKRLAQQLARGDRRVVALQGNMSQPQRERALKEFRAGKVDVLVATDIAARGLDIAGVSHVINYDIPNTPDAYTHRVGRTGRSGLTGTAYTFATQDDTDAVHAIEKRVGGKIPRGSLRDLGLSKTTRQSAAPRQSEGRGGRRGHGAQQGHGGTRRGANARPKRQRGKAARQRTSTSQAPAKKPARADRAAFGLGVTDA